MSDPLFTTASVLFISVLGLVAAALTFLHNSRHAAERRTMQSRDLAKQAGHVLIRTSIDAARPEQMTRRLLDPSGPDATIQLTQIFSGLLREESHRILWRGLAQNIAFFALGVAAPLIVARFIS